MRRLDLVFAAAVLLATVACSAPAPRSAACTTRIPLVAAGGGWQIGEVGKLTCRVGEELDVELVNGDTQNRHSFEITQVGCKGDKPGGKNPVKNFKGRVVDVDAGQTRPLRGRKFLFFPWAPTMLSNDEIRALRCSGDQPFTYSYSIRASGAPEKDPDLDVSPPPAMQ